MGGYGCPLFLVFNTSTWTIHCITVKARLPYTQDHDCCSQGGVLLVHTTSIRPAQCVTPPPSLAAELLQLLQPLPAQATSACKLLSCQIIIKVYTHGMKQHLSVAGCHTKEFTAHAFHKRDHEPRGCHQKQGAQNHNALSSSTCICTEGRRVQSAPCAVSCPFRCEAFRAFLAAILMQGAAQAADQQS